MDIQQTVADGQMLVALAIALAAGLVSFLSPCVLPLVPGYLAYVGGVAGTGERTGDQALDNRLDRRRIVSGVLLFIGGFSLVFVLIMAAAGTVGAWVLQWENIITRVIGILVIAMGLVFVGLFNPFQRTTQLHVKPRIGLAGAPVLGIVFAIGWTPCLGPTLGTIMALSLQTGSTSRAVALGIAYCVGLGLPFLAAALGFGWMTQTMSFFKRHIRAVNLIGGAMMILIGLLMVSGLWSTIMYELQAVIGGYVTPL
jgi:cytochrome c-type biogenesis protein